MDKKTDLESFLATLGERSADGKISIPKNHPIFVFFFKENTPSRYQIFLRLAQALGKKTKENVPGRYRVFLRTARVLGKKTLILTADRQQIFKNNSWEDVSLKNKTIKFRLALAKISVCENSPQLYKIIFHPKKKHLLVYF